MGARGGRRDDAGILAEINVTPLVDVVLVLLVLMMVTATTLATRAFGVELPRARAGDDAPAKQLTVAIDADGAFYVDDVRADEETLRVRARATAGGASPSAVVAADGAARHRAVVRALEILRSERIAKIAIVVRADGR